MIFESLAIATVSYAAQSVLLVGFALLLRHYYRVYHRRYLRFWSYAAYYYAGSAAFALLRVLTSGSAVAAEPLATGLTPYAAFGHLAMLYISLGLLTIGVFDILHAAPPTAKQRRRLYAAALTLAAVSTLPALIFASSAWAILLTDIIMLIVSGSTLLSIGFLIYSHTGESIASSNNERRKSVHALGPRLIAAAFALMGAKNIVLVQSGLFSGNFTISASLWSLQGILNLLLVATAAVGIIIWLLEAERSRTLSALQQAEYLNSHDALTGMENREELMSKIPAWIANCRHYNKHLNILVVGINRFKTINDTLGLRGGDRALVEVSQRLQQLRPRPLTVARISGDVFIVLFDHLKKRSLVEQLGTRIQQSLQQTMEIDRRFVNLSCAVGVARFPQHGVDADTLLSKANIALEQAKQNDDQSVVFYQRGMDDNYVRLIDMEPQLKDAFARNEFVLHLQPLFEKSGQQLSGFEALIRWQHPTRGLIGPDKFLPFVDELGLSAKLDDWVLERCAQLLARWRALGHELLPVAVNISARHFQNPALVGKLRSLIQRYRLQATDIELEITENVAMTDLQAGLNVLTELQQMGMKVSIDDFGTGYSSLAYLRRLPVDKIKIDRSFINELQSDDSGPSGSIVRTLIELSHGLKKRVVAEGVECAEQLSLLREMRCDQVQGYHLSPPLSLKVALELLQHHRASPAAEG